jgi:predicted  nucleic acid-binding Zn-ribbon protein
MRLEESLVKYESAQLRIAVLKNPEELEEIEKASDKLASDLAKENRARKAAERELAKATAMVETLNQQKQELQATVRDLNADLRLAGERAVDVYVLERNVTDLKDEVEKTTRELDSRNQTLADLEKQLEISRNECELLRRRADTANIDEDILSEDAETALAPDASVHSSHVVAKFEQSIRNVRAYQTLREFDPAFYDGLIVTYKKLVGQDLTDKQVNDALRAEQAELIEQLLPRASDDAIIAYARLIVDQLDELQLDGIEPCLSLLIPQSNPDDATTAIYSESTRDPELDILDITLRTYDADRQLPANEDVWPDLEPIFVGLLEAFGADNVAAIQNSYEPSIDRVLVCNVSRALYSGILDFPKHNAANALRWLFSP